MSDTTIIEAPRLGGAYAVKELWSVDDFCAAFGVGKTRAFAMLKRGEIEGVLVGQSRRITRRSIEAWLGGLPRQSTNAAEMGAADGPR